MSLPKDSVNIILDTKRHSMAHLTAAAIKQLFPEAQFGVGPVIENGFFYDFILPRTLIPEDLEIIENRIKDLLSRNLVFKTQEISLEEAIVYFEDNHQPLKVELLNDLRNKGTTSLSEEEIAEISLGNESQAELKITLYRLEDEDTGEDLFVDLCKGPHIYSGIELEDLGFNLDKFSGSYWRGDQARNIQMQRIYGLVFETQQEIDKFLEDREEAKKRDHRVLNETLKYYTISELVGAGLPLFQPNGMILRQNIQDLLWQLHKDSGYKRVWTPHIAKEDLYKASGHAAKFGDELFRVQGKSDSFFMKPMNCPHHMQIFADNQFSYRDMPIRYFEHATVYRDEKPGQLSGFTRVRSITQDDGHLFCSINQIKQEVATIIEIIRKFYQIVGLESSWVSLSVRDPKNLSQYLGNDEAWNLAENSLEEAAKSNGLNYKIIEGEAAFYGPKLDFMFKDSIGRQWQLATIQCDFNLPERFDLSFTNENGEKERPVVIHRAIGGSSERFLGILIDNYGGRFPFWLAPEQVKILTVNNQEDVLNYVAKINDILKEVVINRPLKYNELRYSTDDRNESLGKKIREAETQKIPVIMIVGPKDVLANEVSVRTQEGEQKVKLEDLESFLKGL
jgi:threonyl-tRNA synthetase